MISPDTRANALADLVAATDTVAKAWRDLHTAEILQEHAAELAESAGVTRSDIADQMLRGDVIRP